MLLIKNAKILTMLSKNYDNECILIEGKKIIKIGEDIDVNNSDISEVIDTKDCWVIPGII